MARRGEDSLWHNEAGAAAALYALALPALVAIAGLGFDYARMASMDTELQNAADQAALAGATQLDRVVGAQSRAIAATGNLVSNQTLFANDGAGQNAAVTTVTFFATTADAENGTNGFNNPGSASDDARAAFVRVTIATRRANYALTPIVGALFSDNVNTQAVAGMSSALCRTPPVMMCNPSEPAGNTSASFDFNASAHIGQGFLVTQGGGGAWTPGNFGYLDTGTGNGAPGVMTALGQNIPPGECIAQNGVNTVDTSPGNMASVPDALNTRFDIYETNSCVGTGPCSPSINSRKDVVRPATANSGQGCSLHNNGWQEVANGGMYRPTSGTTPINQALYTDATWPIIAMGHPRDMCHSTDPNSCPGTGIFGNGWDRDAYFRTHYRRTTTGTGGAAGTRWSAAQWQANTGFGANPTRYQVYLWEIANRGSTVDGVVVLGASPQGATGGTLVNHGEPVCSTQQSPSMGGGVQPGANVADRRRISVAIINCNAHNVRGNSTGVPVRRWLDVFLVQPSLDRKNPNNITRKDQIYVEVIGETSAGSSGETAGTVVRRDVPYLVR